MSNFEQVSTSLNKFELVSFMDSPLDKTVDVLEAITRSVKAYTFSVAAIGGNIFFVVYVLYRLVGQYCI